MPSISRAGATGRDRRRSQYIHIHANDDCSESLMWKPPFEKILAGSSNPSATSRCSRSLALAAMNGRPPMRLARRSVSRREKPQSLGHIDWFLVRGLRVLRLRQSFPPVDEQGSLISDHGDDQLDGDREQSRRQATVRGRPESSAEVAMPLWAAATARRCTVLFSAGSDSARAPAPASCRLRTGVGIDGLIAGSMLPVMVPNWPLIMLTAFCSTTSMRRSCSARHFGLGGGHALGLGLAPGQFDGRHPLAVAALPRHLGGGHAHLVECRSAASSMAVDLLLRGRLQLGLEAGPALGFGQLPRRPWRRREPRRSPAPATRRPRRPARRSWPARQPREWPGARDTPATAWLRPRPCGRRTRAQPGLDLRRVGGVRGSVSGSPAARPRPASVPRRRAFPRRAAHSGGPRRRRPAAPVRPSIRLRRRCGSRSARPASSRARRPRGGASSICHSARASASRRSATDSHSERAAARVSASLAAPALALVVEQGVDVDRRRSVAARAGPPAWRASAPRRKPSAPVCRLVRRASAAATWRSISPCHFASSAAVRICSSVASRLSITASWS